MKNTYKNLDDIKRMQEEAIKRVQEMQKRAKLSLEYSQPYSLKNSNQKITEENKKENISLPEEKNINEQKTEDNPLKNKSNPILSLLTGDNEKNLIVLLLMLLVEEKTDISLILALIYLIM